MKKMKLFYGILIGTMIFSACSSDDDNNENCNNEVWGLSKSCTPECVYFVEYGPDENNTTTIETNEATFDFYKLIVEDDNELDCWEGEK